MADRYRPTLPSAWPTFNVLPAANCPVCSASQPEQLVAQLTSSIGRRDWDRIITEIEKHISLRGIAQAVHRSAPTVLSWKISGEPKDSDARRVLALYAKYCGPGK